MGEGKGRGGEEGVGEVNVKNEERGPTVRIGPFPFPSWPVGECSSADGVWGYRAQRWWYAVVLIRFCLN